MSALLSVVERASWEAVEAFRKLSYLSSANSKILINLLSAARLLVSFFSLVLKEKKMLESV